MKIITERCWIISRWEYAVSEGITKPNCKGTLKDRNTKYEAGEYPEYIKIRKNIVRAQLISQHCWEQTYLKFLNTILCHAPERSTHLSCTLCCSWWEEPCSKEQSNLPSTTQKQLLCRLWFLCTTCFSPLSFSPNAELNTQHSSKSWIDNFPWRLDFPLLWRYQASELDGLILASGFPTDCCLMGTAQTHNDISVTSPDRGFLFVLFPVPAYSF